MELKLSSVFFGSPVLNADTLDAIKNAKDRNSIDTRWSRICNTILDWVCWTYRSSAKKYLYDLSLQKESSDIVKMNSFYALKSVVSKDHQNKFTVELHDDGKATYCIELSGTSKVKFTLSLDDVLKEIFKANYDIKKFEKIYKHFHDVLEKMKSQRDDSVLLDNSTSYLNRKNYSNKVVNNTESNESNRKSAPSKVETKSNSDEVVKNTSNDKFNQTSKPSKVEKESDSDEVVNNTASDESKRKSAPSKVEKESNSDEVSKNTVSDEYDSNENHSDIDAIKAEE